MLRGQVGTSFKLKVQRPGTEKPLDFDIVRRSIQLPFIPYYTVLDNNIGYINLSTFSGNPSKEFKQAFLDLKKRGMTSLVIDLRNNGGGLLDESIEIANFFLPRGKTLVTTKGKIKQASNTYKTLREPLDLEIPLAVLVNGGTASSSEILAGSLQDLDRAVIIGNRTFGKGLVQTTRPLPYGGTMKLTTSKYYIPSGRCVQAIDYKNLKEMAEFEGYLTDASKEFEALEKKLSHNLDRDLDHFSKDIKSMIAVEIIKRYYFQRGSIIQQLKDDDDLKEAVKILTAPEKYKEMLSAPAVTSMSLQQRKETAPVFLSTATRANEHVYDEIV